MKTNEKLKQLSRGALFLASGFLLACSDSNNAPIGSVESENVAIIAGVASDYSSSEITLADSEAPYDFVEGYAQQALSDISVAAFGQNFYRIGRFNQDNLTKYDLENPGIVDWQFTTDDDGSMNASNPYDVLFVNENKAYVLRYGEASVWIIDPSVSASDEDNFMIGEIDLSAYDGDGIPQMAAGAIHDGRLYVAMQAMDAGFTPGDAYLAVIDIATDAEINVDADPQNGIPLGVKNPVDMAIIGDDLYIACVGRYERWWIPAPAEYTGGLVKVDLDTMTTELLIDDGDDITHPYGNIDLVTIVSETQGYIKGTTGTNEGKVFPFNPSTGAVGAEVGRFSGLDVRSLAVSPEGNLWVGVGDAANPEIVILDPSDLSEVETLALSTNPRRIVFTSYED